MKILGQKDIGLEHQYLGFCSFVFMGWAFYIFLAKLYLNN